MAMAKRGDVPFNRMRPLASYFIEQIRSGKYSFTGSKIEHYPDGEPLPKLHSANETLDSAEYFDNWGLSFLEYSLLDMARRSQQIKPNANYTASELYCARTQKDTFGENHLEDAAICAHILPKP